MMKFFSAFDEGELTQASQCFFFGPNIIDIIREVASGARIIFPSEINYIIFMQLFHYCSSLYEVIKRFVLRLFPTVGEPDSRTINANNSSSAL
jgi:hypothetical protein